MGNFLGFPIYFSTKQRIWSVDILCLLLIWKEWVLWGFIFLIVLWSIYIGQLRPELLLELEFVFHSRDQQISYCHLIVTFDCQFISWQFIYFLVLFVILYPIRSILLVCSMFWMKVLFIASNSLKVANEKIHLVDHLVSKF